jgi:hypothetical protein
VQKYKIYSLYWSNISPEVIGDQRRVFDALQIDLEQQNMDRKNHGEWMTEILEYSKDEDIVFFCDIDAFPLKSSSFEKALEFVNNDHLFGLAQFSSHTSSKAIYAGPMFLGLKRKIWSQMGRPSLRANQLADAGEILTIKARQLGVAVKIIYPTVCIQPKWELGSEGVFGIGTFYGDLDFFHLFETRHKVTNKLMSAVAHDVIKSAPLNFKNYLSLLTKDSICSRVEKKIMRLVRKISS